MAHSEGQSIKGVQAVDTSKTTDGKNYCSLQEEEERMVRFPWQFVAVIGVIVCSVLGIVLKAIGLF